MNLFFGKNLKFLRKQKDLNQADLAEIVNKKGNTIGNWEAGNAEPNFIELTEIVNFFEIPVFQLLYTDIEAAHLIEQESSGKKEVKSTPKYTPNRTPNRVKEPSGDFANEQKSPDSLVKTLEDLVASKTEIIAHLKSKNKELEETVKDLKKKKQPGHA